MRGTIARLTLLCLIVLALVAAWALTPLRELATPEEIQKITAPLTSSPLLPLFTLLSFVIAGALFLSVWLVIFQTSLLFSPAPAFLLALGGALLSAVVFYALGRALGRDVVVRFAPRKVQDAVAGAGLETIIAVRVLPLLPFTFVNLCCGAFGVGLRPFVVGSIVGMSPGILGMVLLGDRLLAVLRDPTPVSVLGLTGVAGVLVVTAALLRRRAARKAHLPVDEV